MDEGRRILKVLEDYEGELGQKLNKEKTSLLFSKNTLREVQEQIKQVFGPKLSNIMRSISVSLH